MASTSLASALRSTRAFRQTPRKRRLAFRQQSGETEHVRRKVAHTSSDDGKTNDRRLERRGRRRVSPRRRPRTRHGERQTEKRNTPRKVPPGQAEHQRRLGGQIPHRTYREHTGIGQRRCHRAHRRPGGRPHLRRTGAPPLQTGHSVNAEQQRRRSTWHSSGPVTWMTARRL